jgi:hypothetical protein
MPDKATAPPRDWRAPDPEKKDKDNDEHGREDDKQVLVESEPERRSLDLDGEQVP